jgi:DNA-binding transcriptional regulator YiaG
MTFAVAVLVAGQRPMDKFVRYACETLVISESEIARQLGVTPGCLRAWSRRRAPRYARLALAALIVGLDPDFIATLEQMVESQVDEPT